MDNGHGDTVPNVPSVTPDEAANMTTSVVASYSMNTPGSRHPDSTQIGSHCSRARAFPKTVSH